jgi:NAD(P)-dependent dehydrogenase (short-subunit alcohol dehydrogenase family)
MDLHGQVAVVTGSAVGIGRGVCLALAEQGMAVACLDIDTDENEITAQQVCAEGVEVLGIECDIADRAAVGVAISAVAERFGRIDLLVNNAAVYLDSRLTGGSFDDQCEAFERSVGICTFGAFACASAAVPTMQRTGGNIVNIITDHVKPGHSMAGLPATGYDVAKWGLQRLTESWAIELGPLGIRVNGLCFGATDTPMLRGVSATLADKAMLPSDIGRAVLNIVAHGAGGPTGLTPLFGLSGASLDISRAEIAALGPD